MTAPARPPAARARPTAGPRTALARDEGARKEVVTPEGVPITFTVATAGDRAGAFLLDLLVIGLALVALLLLAGMADRAAHLEGSWIDAFLFLAFFLLKVFYWPYFEMRRQGATPGKRRLGLRVVDAAGGPLTAEAVIVRNLTREIEVWMPLAFLVAPHSLWPGAPAWATLLSGAWLLVFALMPLFNRNRLRIGDMVAGTMVVLAPRAVLLEDLGRSAGEGKAPRLPDHVFTDEQLDVYGIYELQVLEDLLRKARERADGGRALRVVRDRIQRKIEWGRVGKEEPESFLKDFYAALRARLESRLLLGKRKADKYSKSD
jgi:uncharacterized RDD family membrane protein YckC